MAKLVPITNICGGEFFLSTADSQSVCVWTGWHNEQRRLSRIEPAASAMLCRNRRNFDPLWRAKTSKTTIHGDFVFNNTLFEATKLSAIIVLQRLPFLG